MLSRFKPSPNCVRPLAAIPVALGALCLAAASLGVQAQETVSKAIPGVVAAGTKIELIKEGFQGTEGPVALPDGSFAFTETTANRITRIAPDGTISTFLENSNGSNGLGFNAKGELISVQVADTRVGVVYPKGQERTLAAAFEGLPFGRPNDLVVDRKGGVYFTDSGPNVAPNQPPSTKVFARPAVYYITPDGQLKRLAADIERPNGIQLSPDEKVLYVANTLGEYVLAYDVAADGSLGPRRNFAKLAGWTRNDAGNYASGADGLAVDAQGRVYAVSNAGVEVFSPAGEALGSIAFPKKPQNLAFAGPGKHTLYVVGRGAAYRIATEAVGYAGRAK